MAVYTLPFGYFPQRLNISLGDISISDLHNAVDTIAAVERDQFVDGDWIYAAPRTMRKPDGSVSTLPYASRIFGLPKTHVFRHAAADSSDHLVFHLWVLSFFTGMRLTSTDAGFIDSTPIKPYTLFDFILLGTDLAEVVALAEAYWVTHRNVPARSKLIGGIVHALLLSQNPQQLQFERFLLLYSALDACYALAKSHRPPQRGVTHSRRVSWMCGIFNMPVPEWAHGESTEIAALRNESVHEALFMGEPLGFALHGVGTNANLTLEMEALICRLLVALLGFQDVDYVVSSVATRQRVGLRLKCSTRGLPLPGGTLEQAT